MESEDGRDASEGREREIYVRLTDMVERELYLIGASACTVT